MTRFVSGRMALVALLIGAGILSAVPARAGDGKYQLMKATENRVWRLNKETGEIAVCTLQGEQLLCATSLEAALPPKKSYDQMRAEKAAAERAAAEHRRKQEEVDIKILDRILAFFRELITLAKEQEAAK